LPFRFRGHSNLDQGEAPGGFRKKITIPPNKGAMCSHTIQPRGGIAAYREGAARRGNANRTLFKVRSGLSAAFRAQMGIVLVVERRRQPSWLHGHVLRRQRSSTQFRCIPRHYETQFRAHPSVRARFCLARVRKHRSASFRQPVI